MIEAMLRNTVIVENVHAETTAPNEVHIGSRVTVSEEGGDDQETYLVVGTAEADPKQGKISHESPLGKSLLGKRAGDQVKIHAPAGEITFKIVKIE